MKANKLYLLTVLLAMTILVTYIGYELSWQFGIVGWGIIFLYYVLLGFFIYKTKKKSFWMSPILMSIVVAAILASLISLSGVQDPGHESYHPVTLLDLLSFFIMVLVSVLPFSTSGYAVGVLGAKKLKINKF